MVSPTDDAGIAGTASLPLLILLVAVPVAALAFLVDVGLNRDWNDVADPIGLTVLLALYGSMSLLVATAGVRVGAGRVLVVGAFTVMSVPARRVVSVRWDDGLAVLSDDGLQAESVALGGSLGGQLTGNRRQRDAAIRLVGWIAAHRGEPDAARSVVRWRRTALAACGCWTVISSAVVLTAAFAQGGGRGGVRFTTG